MQRAPIRSREVKSQPYGGTWLRLPATCRWAPERVDGRGVQTVSYFEASRSGVQQYARAEGVWRHNVEVVADPGEVLEVVGAGRGGAFDFHCYDGAVGALDHEVDFATGAVSVMVEVQRLSAG